jgi:hypothetical protein
MPRAHRRRGTAALEFALIAGPFFVTIIAIMEVCWQLATGAALDHAALKASRFGATGNAQIPAWQRRGTPVAELPGSRTEAVRWLVSTSTGGLIRLDAALLTVTSASWSGLGATGGAAAEDEGGGGAIVSYAITYRQPFITGAVAARIWGGSGFTHRTTIVVKNEPFENGGGLGG